MASSFGRPGDTPRTLFKIILMLGLALAGVAAIAAEPEPSATTDASPACEKTTFEFGGRTIENGVTTDAWTLTCWRPPAPQAAAPKPVETLPVVSQTARQPSGTRASERF